MPLPSATAPLDFCKMANIGVISVCIQPHSWGHQSVLPGSSWCLHLIAAFGTCLACSKALHQWRASTLVPFFCKPPGLLKMAIPEASLTDTAKIAIQVFVLHPREHRSCPWSTVTPRTPEHSASSSPVSILVSLTPFGFLPPGHHPGSTGRGRGNRRTSEEGSRALHSSRH